MDRDDIVTTVLSRLGRQESNAYMVEAAERELGLIQQKLEGDPFLPWFLVSDVTAIAIVAAESETALPADFLREFDDYPVYIYTSTDSEDTLKRLIKDDFDILETEYPVGSAVVAEPIKYAVVGGDFVWFPVPDDNYVGVWRYYKKATALSDSVLENEWTANAADLLVAELGEVMAAMKKDQFWLAKFAADKAAARHRLLSFDEARKQALKPGYRGDRE